MLQVSLPNVDITGGTIEGTPIGATTASTGAFTTISASSGLTVSGTATLPSVDIGGGEIDATPIGANTPSTGVFTSVVSNNAVTSDSISVTNNATVGGTLDVTGNATFTNINVTGTSTRWHQEVQLKIQQSVLTQHQLLFSQQ